MKYRTTKDLPFAKVGTEILFVKNEDLLPTFSLRNINPENEWVVMEGQEKRWERYILDGWIEEEKPREFYIPIDRDTGKLLASDKPMDKGYSGGWTLAVEVIKVREIL